MGVRSSVFLDVEVLLNEVRGFKAQRNLCLLDIQDDGLDTITLPKTTKSRCNISILVVCELRVAVNEMRWMARNVRT